MEEKEIHLRDYWRVIEARKTTVLTFLLIVFTVVLVGTLTATPKYAAATKVLVEENETNPLDNRYAYYRQLDPEFIATQSQIIKGARVARKVVGILKLDTNYAAFFPESKQGGTFLAGLGNWVGQLKARLWKPAPPPEMPAGIEGLAPEELSEAEIIADVISSAITVTPVKESKVIEIGFMSENPVLARLVANTVAKAYMEEILEMKMATSSQTVKWMSQKAEEERTKLAASEKRLQEYMRDQDLVTVEDKLAIIPQQLSEFSTQLSRTETKRKEMENLYLQLQNLGNRIEEAETISVIAGNSVVQTLREQIMRLEQQINELSQKFGPKHPAMIKVLGERDILKEKKRLEIGRVIQSIKKEYEPARANEENVREMLAKTRAEAMNTNEKFVQYGLLKREVETNKFLYEALLAKLKEQNITEQNQRVNVWVVEEARTPLAPASPNKKRNILLGLVLGLFGGVGLAFFLEYLDNTVKSPDEAEERFGLPVLGVVSRFAQKDVDAGPVISQAEPESALSESYKTMRAAILLSAAEAPPKVIQITSMLPAEGKTTTAINLATTMAQADRQVLLIDADMRKPRLHKIFSLNNAKGLSSYLAGSSDDEIIQAGPGSLRIVTAGPTPPNPSTLLESKRMQEFLQTCREKFDVVVIDSPPVVSVADSLLISKVVDGAIVVIRGQVTAAEVVDKGLKTLRDIHAPLLGLVLNAVDLSRHQYYYYGYYGYKEEKEKVRSEELGVKKRAFFMPFLLTPNFSLLTQKK